MKRDNGAPFRVNDLMSGRRFEEIIKNLTFTDAQPPSFKDRFWEVRDMIKAWNDNMSKKFVPSWINCLDESMSVWTNKWTCPGYVFCTRKPKPFGNEYHDICCDESGIKFALEMVEGKDRPKELPSDPKNEATIGLLKRLCKPLYGTGSVVILDSGFCVLKGLVELREQGVFAGALIKKRRYWPKYVPGDEIDQHFTAKEVGATDTLKGVLDNVPYDIFCMKEPDYVMKIMSTYGGLVEKEGQKKSFRTFTGENGKEEKTEFIYKLPFLNHFDFRHIVDDHNKLRHKIPSLEETWVTNRWPVRVFQYLLACTEVNIFLAMRFFVWQPDSCMKFHDFRSKLAWELINNEYLKKAEEDERKKGPRGGEQSMN